MTHHQRSHTVLFAHTLSIKGKRFFRLFAVLLIGAGLLAGIASPAAAENDPARFDGNTYFGLDFGWSVTWDEAAWVDPYETHDDGFEYVALDAADDWTGASARIAATDGYGGDVDTCVENWGYALEAGGLLQDIERTDLDAGIPLPDGAAEGAYTYNTPITDDPLVWVEYVQCRPLHDGTNLIVTLSAIPADYEKMLPAFSDLVDQIEMDGSQPAVSSAPDADSETGDRPNAGVPADTHTGDRGSQNAPGGGIDGAGYTGVNYDWSVTWDSVVWEVPAGVEDNSNGNDYFQLGSTREEGAPPMVVAFETTSIYDGDVNACAEGAAYWVAQDGPATNSNIEEADVRLPKAPGDGSVVALTYTYQRGEDTPAELTAVQVCLPLEADGAILTVRFVTPSGSYSQARGYLEELLTAIEIN